MKKRIFTLLLCVALLICASITLIGCDKAEPLKIVYLGDSIAEALLGPSPVSERENYGYFSIIGRRNDYVYVNRAASGHQSKQLLALLEESDEALKLTSHIKTADVIHISILGNDFLQTNLGETILCAAQNDLVKIDDILAKARVNFDNIYKTLREYNEDAVIMFQTTYNPVSPESGLLRANVRESLAEMDIHPEEYRSLGATLLNMLNGIIRDYLASHPGAFYITDAYAEFDRIYNEDPERGKDLIYADWVHPSNEGHAVMADIIQEQLEELGLADKEKAIRFTKYLRIEQLSRMYSDVVDVSTVRKEINGAKSCKEITKIYFDAIRDKTPSYC
ncbi:SGNH/GDSL hydrolase family protein [bacterium]|nr:SGNH/GDSL hydrolase family protein [bacterium]